MARSRHAKPARKSRAKRKLVFTSVKRPLSVSNQANKRRRRGGKRTSKKKGLYQKAIRGDGHTWSFTRIYGSKRPAFWRIGNRQISSNSYILTEYGQGKTSSPLQGVLNLTRWGNPLVLSALRDYINNATPLQTFFLYSCHVEINITNFSNNPTKVWIYDFSHKKDLPLSGDTYLPSYALTAGATEVSANITDVGQSPFTIPMFTRNYKVHKISELIMNPGETHIHRVMTIYNRLIKPDTLYWSNSTVSLAALAKFTRGCFCIFHGGNVWDNTNNLVSVGSAEIGFTAKHVYKYSWTNDSMYSTHRLNQLPAIAVGQQHVMNNESNTDVLFDEAGPNS